MKEWFLLTDSPEQTQKLGEFLGRCCSDTMAILLEGDLGSGKTCFVQGIARGLGVPSAVPVNSPTYTLMNQYDGRMPVNHFDLYRLGSVDELIDLDFDDYLFGPGITIVEWAGMVERENVSGLSVRLDYGEHENQRSLCFDPLGKAGEEVLEKLQDEWKES